MDLLHHLKLRYDQAAVIVDDIDDPKLLTLMLHEDVAVVPNIGKWCGMVVRINTS